AQPNASLLRPVDTNSTKGLLNMDAIYQRPFMKAGKLPVSIGGYMEGNYQHLGTDGLSDGHEFQFRRMSLFLASAISSRIKFMTEVELENDKEEQLEGAPMEIGIEYAALDLELHPLLNLRGGIILNPIGSFNQNHDAPRWEFTDRPVSSTQLLPATFSNSGLGLYGKYYHRQWMLGYELYLSGGLNESIVDNDLNKTYLPHAKEGAARLVSSRSGEPVYTGKLSVRNQKLGELGISYMGGVYNRSVEDGLVIDFKRRCDVWAVDFNTQIQATQTTLITEWAFIQVQTPATLFEGFGNRQRGGFFDVIQPLWKGSLFGWNRSVISIAGRFDYVDWNIGRFRDGSGEKGDELLRVTGGISFRPQGQTVLRLNYLYQWQNDLIGNPPSKTAGIQFGMATYF
ncbi:MAG TPA: hypothetical protein PLP34_09280, partial [Chitinophagaceae bacterium]|nr:hypothetical protein [Chitinophagaceae bacterium]